MIDLIDYSETTHDLTFSSTTTEKAKNLLTTQLGALEYAQDFGIDRDYFMSEGLIFQNEAFKNYLLQRMAENFIDVSSVIDTIETFYELFTFNLIEPKQNDALMRG